MLRILALAAMLTLGVAATATPALAERPTARASGVQAVYAAPRDNARIVDKLANRERVYLDRCTRQARWCLVRQLDGGPSGWVRGADLVGSPAKVQVTPFEFSFDPLDPLDFRRRGLWPFD
jgi:hypothetical protein